MSGTHAARPGTGEYLRIRIGRTQFLMPVTEPMQVDPAPGGGELCLDAPPDGGTPVIWVDESLRPAVAGDASAACRLLLGSGNTRVMLACEAADVVAPEGVKLYALPPCMHGPGSVFSAAASVGDNIHGVCRAEDLLAVLGTPAGRIPTGSGARP